MTRMTKTAMATVAAACLLLCGCSESDRARSEMKNESEHGCGVMRTVSAYSATGEKIGEWHGKIDVDYVAGSSSVGEVIRVDIVIFDGEDAIDRIVISGDSTVIVDND